MYILRVFDVPFFYNMVIKFLLYFIFAFFMWECFYYFNGANVYIYIYKMNIISDVVKSLYYKMEINFLMYNIIALIISEQFHNYKGMNIYIIMYIRRKL